MSDPVKSKLYEDLMKLSEEERIATLHDYVDDLIYASKGTEIVSLTGLDLKLAIDGLVSALGMAISHMRGHHPEPWNYMMQNILCSYWKVFKGETPEWKKESSQPL